MKIDVNTLFSRIDKSEKAEKIINFCHGLMWVNPRRKAGTRLTNNGGMEG